MAQECPQPSTPAPQTAISLNCPLTAPNCPQTAPKLQTAPLTAICFMLLQGSMRQGIPATGYPVSATAGAPTSAPYPRPPGGPPAALPGSAAAPKAEVSLREKAKQQSSLHGDSVLADSGQNPTGQLMLLTHSLHLSDQHVPGLETRISHLTHHCCGLHTA